MMDEKYKIGVVMKKGRKRKKENKNRQLLVVVLALFGILIHGVMESTPFFSKAFHLKSYDSILDIPEDLGSDYAVLNDNVPNFKEEDFVSESYEYYSDLDVLERCGYAMALIDESMMPKKDRESIGSVKPSGWHTIKYDFIDGKYLYNRCHLIGYQLTGQNANPKNLITCTRTTNTKKMLPFENQVANYIKESHDKVLYRVTPIFKEGELVARGIELEAASFKDKGKSLSFHVYVFNSESGVRINYQTGESSLQS